MNHQARFDEQVHSDVTANSTEQAHSDVTAHSSEQARSNDTSFPFRQDSDFEYLTGFLEPVFYLFSIGVGVGQLVTGFEFNVTVPPGKPAACSTHPMSAFVGITGSGTL